MEKELQTPSEKNFNLSKVKLNPNGGLQADYQITETVGGEPSITDYHANVTRDIHPDLQGLFADLRPIVARVFNITSFLTLIESGEMKATKQQKENARAFGEELINKIDVRGVSWSGTADNVGIVITSVFETPNGLKTCFNTPRIKLGQISFGFEEELEQIVELIKKEVYEFLFNGKQAQLSLFGDTSDNGVAGDDMPEM
jgi:hypothetical protein